MRGVALKKKDHPYGVGMDLGLNALAYAAIIRD